MVRSRLTPRRPNSGRADRARAGPVVRVARRRHLPALRADPARPARAGRLPDPGLRRRDLDAQPDRPRADPAPGGRRRDDAALLRGRLRRAPAAAADDRRGDAARDRRGVRAADDLDARAAPDPGLGDRRDLAGGVAGVVAALPGGAAHPARSDVCACWRRWPAAASCWRCSTGSACRWSGGWRRWCCWRSATSRLAWRLADTGGLGWALCLGGAGRRRRCCWWRCSSRSSARTSGW